VKAASWGAALYRSDTLSAVLSLAVSFRYILGFQVWTSEGCCLHIIYMKQSETGC